jgi:hypothetical protein
MKVEVAIDMIALEGFALAPRDRDRLHAAIEHHLTTLLADSRALPQMRSRDAHRVRAEGPNIRAGADVDTLGASVAKAVYSAMAPPQAKG